jgi:H+-translocating NAD(P) transhydrogenase subunit beta
MDLATNLSFLYLVSIACFIMGIRLMNHPRTAVAGNNLAALGMFIAVSYTIYANYSSGNISEILIALSVGALVGILIASNVAMTSIPEMVSMFNGLGGLASAMITMVSYIKFRELHMSPFVLYSVAFSFAVGVVTFIGSWMAFLKLKGSISGKPMHFSGLKLLRMVVFLALIVSVVWFSYDENRAYEAFKFLVILSVVFGLIFVLPIGGADMPVVISMLNSFSGMAAAVAGFVFFSMEPDIAILLIVGGTLVASSGLILTRVMCRAMNRSLWNVMLGGFTAEEFVNESGEQPHVKETSSQELAMLMDYSKKIMIVPGYGMAVAQAQHSVSALADFLESQGKDISFAIHPVAGRMPGHMNVLLAEANVEYEKLLNLDNANKEFNDCDLVLIIGANDVVNPAAIHKQGSPLYGMPILNAYKAKSIVIFKRSMAPGYAGIQNDLFFDNKTSMLFGDAKKSVEDLLSELKN